MLKCNDRAAIKLMTTAKATSCIAICVAVGLALGACSTSNGRMLNAAQADPDQRGGDILAFLFDTEPSWISASAILRAIADGLSPDALTEEDVIQHGATQYAALETLSPGGSATWRNGRTGHAGDTAVSDAFEMSDGTRCKVFTERIVAGEAPFLRDGIACKAPDKDWEVRTAA